MIRPEDNGGRYKVRCSSAVAQEIKRLQHQASADGRGDLLLAAFRHLVLRLQQYPSEFGEPLYRLPALRLEVRSGVIPPLGIIYGVSRSTSSSLSEKCD